MQGLSLPELVSTTQTMTMELHAFEIYPPFETDDAGHALSLFLSETRLTAVLGNGGAPIVVTTSSQRLSSKTSFRKHREVLATRRGISRNDVLLLPG